ncbi:Cell wall protein [Wickerhamomyces ciferrii]|uniref:Cell wall protein n=1 Tax=Wickerhamomyces ciferrii (strain ATCC 14091 / BCRC 22168 / CBS 111 / JCM 3599 / NBRC 0793 / NRRL Y-1031 F-60-10) TaxID=1206466 RepID=K0KF86_WICCF|nr:Cell wall protein [Wickerhamomyces ciferrii]CCH43765.1 Cell wall protein [Wickerhamomyces ciferrii]
MQFINVASLLALASYVVADSESFGLLVIRSGSAYQNSGITKDGDILAVGGSDYVEGVIDDEGHFKVGDKYVSSNNGKFIVGDSKDSDFAIKDGYLTFHDSQGFTISDSTSRLSLPVGDDTTYALKAISKEGQSVSDFSPSGKKSDDKPASNNTSNTSSSIVPPIYTQTDNGAAGMAKIGLGAGLAAVAALLI